MTALAQPIVPAHATDITDETTGTPPVKLALVSDATPQSPARRNLQRSAGRTQYSEQLKETVLQKYPICRTPEDRQLLVELTGIADIHKLYNIYSRLCKVTRHEAGEAALRNKPRGEEALAHILASRRRGVTPAADSTLASLLPLFTLYEEAGNAALATTLDDDTHLAMDPERRELREHPDEVAFTPAEDRFITERFGSTRIELIGYFLDRSETAIARRARQLGLRAIPRWYPLEQVADWLFAWTRERDDRGNAVVDEHGDPQWRRVEPRALRELLVRKLAKEGLELYDCCDLTGKVAITLVNTASLGRVLLHNGRSRQLVRDFNADRSFIADIDESLRELQAGVRRWEANDWVSHAHICLNPFCEGSFGLRYDGYDEKMLRAHLRPWQIRKEANVTSDEWRPDEWAERPVVFVDKFAALDKLRGIDATEGHRPRKSARLC